MSKSGILFLVLCLALPVFIQAQWQIDILRPEPEPINFHQWNWDDFNDDEPPRFLALTARKVSADHEDRYLSLPITASTSSYSLNWLVHLCPANLTYYNGSCHRRSDDDRRMDVVDDFDNKILDLQPEDRYIKTANGTAKCSCQIVRVAEQKLSDLWNGFVNKMKQTGDKIKNFTNEEVAKIKDDLQKANAWAKAEADKLKQDWNSTKTWIKNLAKKIAQEFINDWAKLQAAKQYMKNETLAAFHAANSWIHQLAVNISKAAGRARDWVNKTIQEAEEDVEAEWADIVEHLDELEDDVKQQWNQVSSWVKGTAQNITNYIEQNWEKFKAAAQRFANKSKEAFRREVNKIRSFIVRVDNETLEMLGRIDNWVKDVARNVSRDLNDTAHAIADDIEADWEWIHLNWNILKEETRQKLNQVAQWLKEAAARIVQEVRNDVVKIKTALATLKNETIEIWNGVKDWVHDLAVNVSKEINATAHAVAQDIEDEWQLLHENYDRLSAEAKEKLLQIEQWINQTAHEIADTVVDWVHNVVQEVKDAWHRDWRAIKKGLQRLDNKTLAIYNDAKEWMKELAQNISKKAQVTWNKTKDFAGEVLDDTEEAFEIIIGGVILMGEEVQEQWKQLNKWIVDTAKKAKEGLENFAENVVDAIEGWVEYEKEKLINKTAIFISKSKDAFNRTKRWFKKLMFCPVIMNCDPQARPFVCIVADNGEEVTFLNRCFAVCGGLEIKYDGACKNTTQSYAYVVDNNDLNTPSVQLGKL